MNIYMKNLNLIVFSFLSLAISSCSSSEERKPFMIVNRPSEYAVYVTPGFDIGVGDSRLEKEDLPYVALDNIHFGGRAYLAFRNPIKGFALYAGKHRHNYSKYGGEDDRDEVYSLKEDRTQFGITTGFPLGIFGNLGLGLGINYSPFVKSEFNLLPVNGLNLADVEVKGNELDIFINTCIDYIGVSLGYRVTDYDLGFKNKYLYMEISFYPFFFQLY